MLGTNLGCQGKLSIDFKVLDRNEILSDRYVGFSTDEELNVLIFGAGADATPLKELLDWTQWRYQFFTRLSDIWEQRLEENWNIKHMPQLDDNFELSNAKRTAVILMSHNYPYDLDVMAKILPLKVPYIGCLGPKTSKVYAYRFAAALQT